MANYQKLGLDRLSQNIARAVNKPTGNLVTGDITKGKVVTIEFTAGNGGSAEVGPRRVGAIPLSAIFDGVSREMKWDIQDTTLVLTLNSATTGLVSFWVF